MKHLFTIVLTLCLFGTVAAQDTVSGPDGKLNGWYASYWMYDCFEYYDTNDYTNFLHRPNLINLFTHSHENYMILGKGERVKYPAAVKGVSVLVKDWREYLGRSASWKVADTNRLPEYIYIYQRGPAIDSEDYFHSLILLASVRWDTAKCQILKIPMNADTNRFGFKYCQLYTVYFDKPVEVDSLFFMFGTFNNYGFADDLCVYLSHPPTVYTGATKYERNPAIACPYAFSTPQLIYSFHPDHDITLDLTGEGLLEFWGLFMPFIDFVNLHVLSADSSRGIAGPYDTVSKNTTQHIWARPYRGYHFTHWNDGDTNNPRDIRLMCDTTFVAYFDTNILYHVEVSSNRDWGGRVDGGGDYYENETAELRAVPLLSNYRFVHWSDGDTSNPRHVLVTQDTAFEAHFARDGEGIEQPEDGTPFSLSPNPTRDEVTVTADVMAGTVCRLTLHDETGRELLRRKMEGSTLTISTRGLAAGLYFVTLDTPQGSCTKKMIVEN